MPVHPDTLIVGGGIAGIQAALEIANSGHKVYLVEKEPSIGGHMMQLDKTFPTLDCSACILTPKMSLVGAHPSIELLTYSEVDYVSGYVGNFRVKIRKKARYVDATKCNGCGTCMTKCPVKIDSEFDEKLSKRKAIYTPFAQAVPNVTVIDKEHCTYFLKGKCRACEKFCETERHRFPAGRRDTGDRGRQYHPDHRLRAIRPHAHQGIRLRPAGQRCHQPGVRAHGQLGRADLGPYPAQERRGAEEHRHHPLRGQPR